MGRNERRNVRERSALVRRLIKGVLQNPSLTLSVETLQAWLNVPVDAAERILTNLVSAGLVREVRRGVWVPGPLPAAVRLLLTSSRPSVACSNWPSRAAITADRPLNRYAYS